MTATGGLIGFIVDNQDKLALSDYDAQPEELGINILQQSKDLLYKHGINDLTRLARNIIVADKDLVSKPICLPAIQRVKLIELYDRINQQRQQQEYPLPPLPLPPREATLAKYLAPLQGNLSAYLELALTEDCSNYIVSHRCNYAYLINLDNQRFEIYRGNQSKKHQQGKFASYPAEQPFAMESLLYPIKKVLDFPLNNLPSNQKFLQLTEQL